MWSVVLVVGQDFDRSPVAEPVANDDVWTFLSEQWWTPWLMLLGSLVVGVWMIRSLVIHRGRAEKIAAAARESGMVYASYDGSRATSINFQQLPTGPNKGWAATNAVTLRSEDGDVRGFDTRQWVEVKAEERSAWKGSSASRPRVRRSSRGPSGTAAIAPLPINGPRLLVVRENVASKLFASATRLDLDVESDLFNRSYHVVGADRRFAKAILDAQMIDLMVSTEGRVSFEFFGRYLLLTTTQLEPELIPGLVRLADQMRRVVSPLAIERWPVAARLEID